MSDKALYSNDLIHRFASHTFTETTVADSTIVDFKDSGSVIIASAHREVVLDAYRAIRLDVLGGEIPLYLSTTTERDALTSVDDGTHIHNLTKARDETYNGSSWIAAGGEQGDITHLPAATVTTTDNTQTTLSTVTLDENTAYLFTAEVIGETTDHATICGEIIEVTAKRLTGDAIIVGSVSTPHSGKDSGAASWATTFTVSGNDLRVSVTGGNSTTVNWEADLNYLQY